MLCAHTLLGGKREGGRRTGEVDNIFVDRFPQSVFLLAGLVLLLNCLDAFFTLFFLGMGGEEVNPVALFMLDLGPMVFLAAKTLGIGLCTAYLVLVRKFKGVTWGFVVVLAIYFCLLAWHLYLYGTVDGS